MSAVSACRCDLDDGAWTLLAGFLATTCSLWRLSFERVLWGTVICFLVEPFVATFIEVFSLVGTFSSYWTGLIEGDKPNDLSKTLYLSCSLWGFAKDVFARAPGLKFPWLTEHTVWLSRSSLKLRSPGFASVPALSILLKTDVSRSPPLFSSTLPKSTSNKLLISLVSTAWGLSRCSLLLVCEGNTDLGWSSKKEVLVTSWMEDRGCSIMSLSVTLVPSLAWPSPPRELELSKLLGKFPR